MVTRLRQGLSRSLRSHGRLWYGGFAAFLGVTLAGSAIPTAETTPATAAPAPQAAPASDESYPPAAPVVANMDDAVRIIETARERYREVHDYRCRMVQRERVDDQLPPETALILEVRVQPFSVHMKWSEPRSMLGQEAVYVAGRNAGKMRVRGAGLLGAVGFITLDVDDARARRTSRHNITEAGFGNLIERFAEGWPNERRHGGVDVKVEDFTFANRPCTRVETVHASNADHFFLFSRSVVYFDKVTHFPVRVENYDWPKKPGEPANLLEEYSYLDMQVNPGLGDDVFNH